MGDFSGIGPWIVILVVGAQSIAVVDDCATQNEYKQRDCSKNGAYTMIRHHCHLVYCTRALSVDGIDFRLPKWATSHISIEYRFRSRQEDDVWVVPCEVRDLWINRESNRAKILNHEYPKKHQWKWFMDVSFFGACDCVIGFIFSQAQKTSFDRIFGEMRRREQTFPKCHTSRLIAILHQ